MPTIIDSLIVTLGLDTKGFKEGAADAAQAQEKLKAAAQGDAKAVSDAHSKAGASAAKLGKSRKSEAEAEEKRSKNAEAREKRQHADRSKRTDQTIQGLKSLGLYAAEAVIGFKTLEGAVQAYAATSTELANLSRKAPTIGASVKELGVLGKAYNIVGGNADDAANDIAKLAHAQFSFAMHAPDAMAGLATRLGVSLFDPKTGKQRDKLDILKDIGERLRASTMDVQTQAMYAREMGLSEAAIQLYVVKTADERERALDLAEKENRATAEAAKNAEKQAEAWARIKNNVKGTFESIAGTLSPTVTRVLNAVGNAMENAKPFKDPLASLGLGKGADAGRDYKGADAPYRGAFAAAEKKHHLPAGLLAAIAKQESNFNPAATSAAGAKGLMQIMPKNFKTAGQDAGADIEWAAAELSRLYRHYKGIYPSGDTAWKLAIGAYNAGQGTVAKRTAAGKPLNTETQNYVPRVLGNAARNAGFSAGAAAPVAGGAGAPGAAAGSGGGTTSVQIDNITVNTQATDANGVAAALPGALARKGVVAQANSGLN